MLAGAEFADCTLELTGRITTASNATFLGTLGETLVVYKPSSGEKPLWDFPRNDLARREVAAYLVSDSFGWNIVPQTWLRDGPLGEGMVQLWQEVDPDQNAVDLVAAKKIPDSGWRRVFDGVDARDRPITLVHEDSVALRRMAVFDAVVNNADRKGAHVLEMPNGHRHGVDHGLTFHEEHKLRTVLWGWMYEELNADELEGIDRVLADVNGALGTDLAGLIGEYEILALIERCEQLREDATFPAPHGDMPAMPWPIF